MCAATHLCGFSNEGLSTVDYKVLKIEKTMLFTRIYVSYNDK